MTPVSETITSPEASSFISYLRRGSATPILAARSIFSCDIEDETALHLATDAAQRAGREHALGRAADAEIKIDAGFFRPRREDDAGDIAVRNDAQRGSRRAGNLR